MLTNPKPLGWAYGETLTSTQMNSFGTQLPYAVDGNAGGTYEPTNPIIIDGDGIELPGGIGGSVAVGTNITAGGNITAASGTISGADLAATDDLTVGDDATITGSLYAGTLRFNAAVGADADTTITVGSSANVIIATSLSAQRTYDVVSTGAQAGDWFLFQNVDATDGLVIERDGTPIPGIGAGISGGQCLLMIYVGGSWQYVAWDSLF